MDILGVKSKNLNQIGGYFKGKWMYVSSSSNMILFMQDSHWSYYNLVTLILLKKGGEGVRDIQNLKNHTKISEHTERICTE